MPDEVASYSAKIGYPIDGQGWCDFYAAKGWMVGRVKMKDWRAAARNWKRNRWKPGESVNGSAYPQPPAKKIPLEPANWRELFRIHYPNNEWANDHRDWAQRPSNEQASIISAIRSIPASALREA